MRSTKAIIHLDYLKDNIQTIRSFVSQGTKMCVAVKADAYGHGAIECAKAAVDSGVEFLAVATVDEGIALRQSGINIPILLLSLCSPTEIQSAVEYYITPLVFDKEYISLFDEAAALSKPVCRNPYAFEKGPQGDGDKTHRAKFPVHLAIDTGMGRIGCLPEDAAEIAKAIATSQSLMLGGMQTHFAVSDSSKQDNRAYTKMQFELFTKAIDSVKQEGIDPGICHCANSAATLDMPETHLDMVRPGIIVYGYYPDQLDRSYFEAKGTPIDLKPVMTLETEVCAIRPFAEGKSISYGRTWKAPRATDIAVLPIGYGDALFRRFSPAGVKVAINGKEYPICGRICMDQCMVDIGIGSGIQRWQRAVIFGSKGDGALQTADDIARMTNTISYEITTAVTKRVPRVFIG